MEVGQAWTDEYEERKFSAGVFKGELVSISVIWNLLSKPGGPKPAWIYRDTGEILVSQFKVT